RPAQRRVRAGPVERIAHRPRLRGRDGDRNPLSRRGSAAGAPLVVARRSPDATSPRGPPFRRLHHRQLDRRRGQEAGRADPVGRRRKARRAFPAVCRDAQRRHARRGREADRRPADRAPQTRRPRP
ncbi:hypothetical protein LTR94_033112, partial [Friedmanniomyces endolithicus]